MIMNIKTKFAQTMSKYDSYVKILPVAFILLLAVSSLVVINESAKVTNFEECESAGWLVRSITLYDYAEYIPNAIEKKCVLWTGKTFVKYLE